MEENQNEGVKKKRNARTNIPVGDMDFGTVANDAVAMWKLKNWLTLQYTTQPEAEQKVALFNSIIGNRKDKGGDRPQYTVALETINKEINDSIKYIKGYLSEEHGDEGKEVVQSYYPAFGIVKRAGAFEIPVDASKRKIALDLMLKGITANNFQTRKYGLTYWTDIKTRYDGLVQTTRDLDGGIADKVGEKNVLKEEIKEVLVSLINVLEGNFPKTYPEQLRKWGFQKEKY